jgi:hypothetical protein
MPFVNAKTGKRTNKELMVFVGEFGGDPDGIGVLVDPNTGKATFWWADGTKGISDEVAQAAEDETEAYMPYTLEQYIWKRDKPAPKFKTAPKSKPKKRSSTATLREIR